MKQPAVILVVDDVDANRQTILELLDTPEYRFVEAANGPEALRLAAEQLPDLILLDVMMPEMDGFEVCRRIRADGILGEVPVIIVTALDDQASRLAGLEAGADDFITNPFNRTELRARVRTITRLNRYRRLHEAEAALRRNEEWLQAIFNQAAVGVAQIDANTGQCVRFNQRYCDFIGYSSSEVEKISLAAITHEQDREQERSSLESVRSGAIREYVRERRYVRKDGSVVWASVAVSGIDWRDGTPTAFLAVVLDITERKRLDGHFLQAQKMEALGQFSGGVAHDFNNILAVIAGHTELAQMVLEENPRMGEHLASIATATKRAADLVRQILAFSRQEPQARDPARLHTVVAESVKLLRAMIPSSVELETSIATDTPPVLANANQIHQVLTNLGINAWHALKDRPGRIGIKLERFTVSAEYAATQRHLRPGECVRISVSDNGSGMDPATLSRIFEPFFTTKPVGHGTGLGLSVVHGIMDSHDGALSVQSELGQGTLFSLYFPICQDESHRDVVKEGPVSRGNGESILIVDDEEMLAMLLKEALLELGYRSEYATDPGAALALVRADPGRFDLVLSDQTMPGMTGLVLAGALKQLRADLPFILMTGYSLSLTTQRLEEARVNQLILKPISIQALGTAVRTALAGQSNLGYS